MNINVSSLYNEIVTDIYNNMNLSSYYNRLPKSSTSKISSLPTTENNTQAIKPETENFEEILIQYLKNGNTDIDATNAIQSAVSSASQKYDVDENLIKAIIRQESNYNPEAVSHAGAMGLMQLMPKTAQYLGVDDPYNVYQNVSGGTKYLKELLNTFENNEELALAAYNAGPSAVKKYDDIPPYKETQNYVPKVLEYKEQYMLDQYKNASSEIK